MKFAVMTSGGDAQGMNAAVRAIVRSALVQGHDIYLIMEGYQGMVVGGSENIVKANWNSVKGFLSQGGTLLGTSRCMEFLTPEGRAKAVLNLIQNGIDHLICIGGDGSLTGANILVEEWPEIVKNDPKISEEQKAEFPFLYACGLVGSIDNDMSGTDMTIGADSALNIITEAVDKISTTAASHQRTFIVETMGRHCGFLAVASTLATGAVFCFIPEVPPSRDWPEKLKRALTKAKDLGQRQNIIIVAEGATDIDGNPITSQNIKTAIQDLLGWESRITILGHVQRGGKPYAFDRVMSTLQGLHAFEQLKVMKPGSDPLLIGVLGPTIITEPMMECVNKTKLTTSAIDEKMFSEALELRGSRFVNAWKTLLTLGKKRPIPKNPELYKALRENRNIGIIHVGKSAPGMNMATYVAVRLLNESGYGTLIINNGFLGMKRGEIKKSTWSSVQHYPSIGGCIPGVCGETVDECYDVISRAIQEHKLKGLLVIGGAEAYIEIQKLWLARHQYPSLRIPVIIVPADIRNSCPGTNYSIGCDTSLNCIVDACDKLKTSSTSTRRRIFVVEIMGGYCGYLAVASAIAAGADVAYIPETGISLSKITNDISRIKQRFSKSKQSALILNAEKSSELYTTGVLVKILRAESDELYDVRKSTLGHVQDGGIPCCQDRVLASEFVQYSVKILNEYLSQGMVTYGGVGIKSGDITFTPIDTLMNSFDKKFLRPLNPWWHQHLPTISLLHR